MKTINIDDAVIAQLKRESASATLSPEPKASFDGPRRQKSPRFRKKTALHVADFTITIILEMA
jgi:hypothetical protein